MSQREESENESQRIEAVSPKSLKFAEEHIDPILRGEKWSTIRVDLEAPPQIGERIHLCDQEDERFASAVVSDRGYESIDWLVELGIDGHRDYDTVAECTAELKEYYPDAEIAPKTCVDIVYWEDLWQ